MFGLILGLLFLFLIALCSAVLVLQGAHTMAAVDDILAAQASITASLAAIAAQQAGSATAAQIAQILSNETANATTAASLVIPP